MSTKNIIIQIIIIQFDNITNPENKFVTISAGL